MRKITKINAETFTNTFDSKCGIIDLLGCRTQIRRLSFIHYYTGKKRGRFLGADRAFCFREKFFCGGDSIGQGGQDHTVKRLSASAHSVFSSASAACGVAPMAVIYAFTFGSVPEGRTMKPAPPSRV